MRHAIARFCKGKTFHGAWHLYANLAPAEESFIGQAKVFDEDEAVRLLKPEYRQGRAWPRSWAASMRASRGGACPS